MNCKPGDLAVIVWAPPTTQNLIGKIVRVKTLSPYIYPQQAVPFDTTRAWDYAGQRLHGKSGLEVLAINDCCLSPIRDQDGEDEMLRIVGKPQEVTA